MNEYDSVEVLTDHLEYEPRLYRGARGIVVDLPADSGIAAVEFETGDAVQVALLHLDELRRVEPAGEPASGRRPE